MTISDFIGLSVGAVQLALAFVILWRLRGFWRTLPWLAPLMLYFALRGGDRVSSGIDLVPALPTLATDIVLLGVLLLLFVGLERTVTAVRVVRTEAAARTADYERALADYRTLARHRLANPLVAIRGGIETLRARELDRDMTQTILANMAREAERLEQVALDPSAMRAEERDLRPCPDG